MAQLFTMPWGGTGMEQLRQQTRFRTILQGEAAFCAGSFTTLSKSGVLVRTNPAMKNYQELFKQEFAGESRIQDMAGPGLPLGLQTLALEDAFRVLQKGKPPEQSRMGSSPRPVQTGTLHTAEAFIREERERLILLRDIMIGTIPVSPEKLEILLDECDYLWTHFPECAGAGGRRPSGEDISFLNRVRTEIDPLVRCFDIALQELENRAG
jgi:hypothetical protein